MNTKVMEWAVTNRATIIKVVPKVAGAVAAGGVAATVGAVNIIFGKPKMVDMRVCGITPRRKEGEPDVVHFEEVTKETLARERFWNTIHEAMDGNKKDEKSKKKKKKKKGKNKGPSVVGL